MLNSIDVWRFVKVACCSTFLLAPSTVSVSISLACTPSLSRTLSLSLYLSRCNLNRLCSTTSFPSSFLRYPRLLRPSVSFYAHTRTRYIPTVGRLTIVTRWNCRGSLLSGKFREFSTKLPRPVAAARAFRVPTRIFTLSTRTWHWRSSEEIVGSAVYTGWRQ